MDTVRSTNRQITRILGGALIAALSAAAATNVQAQSATPAKGSAPATWNEAIARTPVPHAGCFKASFPSTTWKEVACQVAPAVPFIPATGIGGGQTVGNGNDYAAEVSGTFISTAVGSFPLVKGLTSEEDNGVANDYSLQLNSNFMSGSPACDGASNPTNCRAWEQFVYASGYHQAFMQYWLINYDTTCPGGWFTYGSDCYKNSSSVSVPIQVIKQLKNLSLSGAAIASGIDTLILTTKSAAYSTTGQDTVVYLADGWTGAEFNVVGDGGGSQAVFNTGTKLKDEIALVDGQTTAPTCQAHAGTTGETNNLNLGNCKTSSGVTPSILFVESN